jgi:hypothetical protein
MYTTAEKNCGYTTDPEKNCNGTHNVVKAVKAESIQRNPPAVTPRQIREVPG